MGIAIDTLAYARRLREAGFSEQQAEGQAEALAATMTETLATKVDLQALATKQDLRDLEARMDARFSQVDVRFVELEARIDARFSQVDIRFAELEKRIELRFSEQTALLHKDMADLERRMTIRLGGIMVAGIGIVSAIVKLG